MKQPGNTFEPQSGGPETITNPSGEIIALRFDVLPLLESEVGPGWQEKITSFIEASPLVLRPASGHDTNREAGTVARLGLLTADGQKMADTLPGVWELYRNEFKTMMQQVLPTDAKPLRAYDDPELALEGLAQLPVEAAWSDKVQHRLEAHVDLRYTAVLIIDAPADESDGGRLVISNDPHVQSIEEINQDATTITHTPATLVCFVEGRKYPHYTEEITNSDTKRVVISLNYPLEDETPEAAAEILRYIVGADQ